MTTTPVLWRVDQQANTTDSGANGDDQTGIKIVGLANGNFVALWESNTDEGSGSPNGTDIIGQLYNPEGNPIGGEFRANRGSTLDDEGDFTAAALPNGNFVIAYEDTNVNGTTIRYDILDANGSMLVQSDGIAFGADLGAPSVTVNSDGSFLVAYQARNVGSSTATFGVIVDAAGVAGSPIALLTSSDSGANGQQVDATTLTNGNYVIVGRCISAGGDSYLAMRILNSTGGHVLIAQLPGTFDNGAAEVAPAVAALSGGGFVAVWQNTDSSDTDVLFQIYNAAGVAQSGLIPVDDGGLTDDDRTPDVVGLSDGGFVVVWDNNEAGTIAMQRFNASGTAVGVEQVVATDGTFSGHHSPQISLSEDGRLLLGWGTSTGIFPNADNDVRFAVWDPREPVINGDGTSEVITAFANGGTVNAGGGNDTVFAADGSDILRGGSGDDFLNGRGGHDILNGDTGADTMVGGFGNDTFAVDDAGDQVIDSNGQGTDLVNSSVSFNLNGSYVENLTLTGAANINATGNGLANILTGNLGVNTLIGFGGNDTMRGSGGNDLYGVAEAGDIVDESIAGSGGIDTVNGSISINLSDTVHFRGAIEHATLIGSANLYVYGNALNNVLTGNAGANTLVGYAGADIMRGLGGNDLYGVDNVGDIVDESVAGSNGVDTVNASISININDAAHFKGSIENASVIGSANLSLTGNTLGNVLNGNAGANVITGWLGNDTLTGGAGNDIFQFNSALNATTNRDVITDMNQAGNDTIRLENSVFTTLAAGALAAAAFRIGGAAADANDRIVYNSANGQLIYDTNGNAAGGATLFAILDPGLTLTAADFFVV